MLDLTRQIEQLDNQIEALVERLRGCGYVFDRPAEVFPGPEAKADEVIERIESVVGRIPEALKLFWLRVGSVDLSGSHPDWKEPAVFPDPLIVFPATFALYYLEDEQGNRVDYDEPFQIVIAPDANHKADVSGGAPYSVSVPAVDADPPLNGSPVAESFLDHLRRSLRAGGFPGLTECAGHDWPLDELGRVSAER